MLVTPNIGLWIGLTAGLIGIFAGISAQGEWQQWLHPMRGVLRLAPVLFVDAARASRTTGAFDTRMHVDAGAGLRLAAPGTGTLRVQTRPWSKVSIDGRPVGTTPLMNVPLSAGSHTLVFTNDDFGIKKVVKVQIEAGQVLTQVLTLTE